MTDISTSENKTAPRPRGRPRKATLNTDPNAKPVRVNEAIVPDIVYDETKPVIITGNDIAGGDYNSEHDFITESTLSELEAIELLTRDLKDMSKTLSRREIRFLVNTYYTMQNHRIRINNQLKTLYKLEEQQPHKIMEWFGTNTEKMENEIKKVLDKYSKNNKVGVWLRSQIGIGPVIASGLLSHIDIHKTPTSGHLWSYAGLNPRVVLEKGKKRPWNAELKMLAVFKAGESFVKVCNKDGAIYGQMYRDRKIREHAFNDCLQFKEQAALGAERVGKTTEAYTYYSIGKLPPAHIHARARRWAVKMFLSHLHEVYWRTIMGTEPVQPFALSLEGHSHYVPPPGPFVWKEDFIMP